MSKKAKKTEVMETSMAVALAAKMCKPDVIPIYPITPQTHIVENLAEFISNGEFNAEMISAESEHSAISAAIGAEAAGGRVFTASSSQGLALMHEILFVVSGLRLPVVMAVANRSLSAPINIWNDHQDSISQRDTGWIQLYVESAQEAFDTTVQAYKIAEDEKILTPIMVCMDGFTLTHVYEPVETPEQKKIDSFIPPFKLKHAYLNPKKPMTIGPIAYPNTFMEIKKAQHDAINASLQKIVKVNNEFNKKFKRKYGDGLVETYKIKDAQFAVIAMGSVCGTIREVVDELRAKKIKIGMIKVRCFRPFPEAAIKAAMKTLKAAAVIDRNISLGSEGALYTEIKSCFYDAKKRPLLNGFILGLGGRDITKMHIKSLITQIKKQDKTRWVF